MNSQEVKRGTLRYEYAFQFKTTVGTLLFSANQAATNLL